MPKNKLTAAQKRAEINRQHDEAKKTKLQIRENFANQFQGIDQQIRNWEKADRDAAVVAIAKQVLDLETLETRNMDRLDFSEQSVAGLKKALELAYEAGRQASNPARR